MFRRFPNHPTEASFLIKTPVPELSKQIGLVLSGGGARAAFQVGFIKGVLRDLDPKIQPFSVLTGSSVGSLNCYILAAKLKHGTSNALDYLSNLWLSRSYRNTFRTSFSAAFLKSLFYALLYSTKPKIWALNPSILNPEPLAEELKSKVGPITDQVLRESKVEALGIMTTLREKNLKGVLFVKTLMPKPEAFLKAPYETVFEDEISEAHCLASAALPSVMPPIKIELNGQQAYFIDGGLVQNIPVDPAVRLGSEVVFTIDVSGRSYWKRQLGLSQDARAFWESSPDQVTHCLSPRKHLLFQVDFPLGEVLKNVFGKDLMKHLGPILPLFTLIKRKLGEQLALEAATYVTIHRDFIEALIDLGFKKGRDFWNVSFKPFQDTLQLCSSQREKP
jgi:predicted acylesterase/phospholipase RssA